MSEEIENDVSVSEEPASMTQTINDAIVLVDRSPKEFKDWRIKELGLQLVLFGLAEVQARRVSQLAGLVYNLENEVFKEENIRQMEPSKLINLYKMGVEALNESSNYVRSTLKSIDWANVEAQLLQVAASDAANGKTSGDDNVAKIVNELLSKLTTSTAPVLPPQS